MRKKLHVVLLGLPNGGKGTLTRQLQNIFRKKGDVLTEIPMSTILRKECPESVEWMEKGELVPDELVIPVALRAIKEAEGDVIIYDGFPRKDTQVPVFLEAIKEEDVYILELNTPKEVAIQRAENRLVCSNCGDTWSKIGEMAPMESGRCDTCGGQLIRRKDDELIEQRIRIHEKYMIPAAALLKEQGIPSVTMDYERTEEEYIAECLSLLIS